MSLTLTFPFLCFKSREETSRLRWGFLGAFILFSSTYFAFAKELSGTFSPVSLAFLGEFLSAFFVTLSFGFFTLLRELSKLRRSQWIPLIAMATCTGIVGPNVFLHGVQSTTAMNSELFSRIELVFVFIFSAIFLRSKISTMNIVAIATIVLGAAIVALQGFRQGFSLQSGDTLVAAGFMIMGVGSLIFKKYLNKIQPEVVIFMRFIAAAAFFFAIAPFREHTFAEELQMLPLAALPALIGFGFVSRFLSVFCFYESVKRFTVTQVFSFETLSIIVTAILAHFYLGEVIEWYHYLGGGLIIAGILAMQAGDMYRNSEEHVRHMRQHHRHHF